MSKESISRATREVWPWRTPPVLSSAGRIPRRWRAGIQSVVIMAVATLLILILHHVRFGMFLYGLAAVVLISGLFIPPVFNGFERAGRWLGHGIGIGLTWLLLTPFYFLCMVPGRLILLILGKDPMCRRWDRQRDSYWMDHKPAEPQSYTRQY